MDGSSSSTITKVNGMVVVTQVFPGPDTREAGTPGPGRSAPHPPDSPVYNPVKVSEMTATFLRGQPQFLGIAQMFIGAVCVCSGLIGFLDPSQILSLPLLASIIFFVSGAVAVAARRGTNASRIRATLGLHVLSALVALAAMVYVPWLLATQAFKTQICPEVGPKDMCMMMLWSMQTVLNGVWIMTLVLAVAEFSVAVSLCVFSVQALRSSKPYQVEVATGDYSPKSESDVSLLGPDGMDPPSA
ncbi:membrane-spanning 4-domains subfamily A member 4A [Gadus chalcogrammus]|uniref:membrane-spanning 4-domains subfamily A member 4A n=1 Tax=Gadus chalcogrammus TaxID=1042646 RepID=UPI0024C3524E|nr:membrane-spanning 4-domains subfamily A member 4A [Gadus chalcogrammus]XP_056447971.1 membrane-spanning 4-domains subfamily A member 4A [Gadus chalcogrammus]